MSGRRGKSTKWRGSTNLTQKQQDNEYAIPTRDETLDEPALLMRI